MTPTPEQLAAEITDPAGPLYHEYAPHWQAVFPHEPEPPEPPKLEDGRHDPAHEHYQRHARHHRIKHRFGHLTPDGAYAIHAILTDESRRRVVESEITHARLYGLLTPVAVALVSAPLAVQEKWEKLLAVIHGAADAAPVPWASVVKMLDTARADGLIDSAQHARLTRANVKACSRAEELGWNHSWAWPLVQDAKAVTL